jgi:hypothetical protein
MFVNMKQPTRVISRREFIQRGAHRAGVLTVSGAVVSMTARTAVAEAASKNPFAYDVDRLAKTDPKLVRYDPVSQFASPVSEPRRIAIGAEDRIYIAGRTGASVLSREGAEVGRLATDGPARCIAEAGDGSIYVGLRDHVEVFDRKGQRLAAWEAPGKRPWLSGLAVAGNDLLAADSGNRLVWRYDRSGKLLNPIGAKDKEHNISGLIVPSPYLDVGLGHDGLLRVNNPGRHRVEVYTLKGELELAWGRPSAAIEGFCGCCNPIGLALLPDGRCVTCEKGLPRVKIYGADGTFECVVAGPESFPENGRACSARGLQDCTTGGLDAAIDSQGRIYILDLVAAEVRVMKPKA